MYAFNITMLSQLFLIDISDGSKLEIPRLSNSGPVPSSTTSCGIHSISISPGGEYVATGGQNPNYLALYSLPQILPLTLGEVSYRALVSVIIYSALFFSI